MALSLNNSLQLNDESRQTNVRLCLAKAANQRVAQVQVADPRQSAVRRIKWRPKKKANLSTFSSVAIIDEWIILEKNRLSFRKILFEFLKNFVWILGKFCLNFWKISFEFLKKFDNFLWKENEWNLSQTSSGKMRGGDKSFSGSHTHTLATHPSVWVVINIIDRSSEANKKKKKKRNTGRLLQPLGRCHSDRYSNSGFIGAQRLVEIIHLARYDHLCVGPCVHDATIWQRWLWWPRHAFGSPPKKIVRLRPDPTT